MADQAVAGEAGAVDCAHGQEFQHVLPAFEGIEVLPAHRGHPLADAAASAIRRKKSGDGSDVFLIFDCRAIGRARSVQAG
jgi:hypothetical protein